MVEWRCEQQDANTWSVFARVSEAAELRCDLFLPGHLLSFARMHGQEDIVKSAELSAVVEVMRQNLEEMV